MADVTDVRGPTATDRLMLGFVAVNTAIVLARAGQVAAWPWLVLANSLLLSLVLLLARAPSSRFIAFVGAWYPSLLMAGYYAQIDVMTLELGVVHDAVVQRWEVALFGGQVSVTWHERMPSLALSWVLHLCYGSYYLLMLSCPLVLVLGASREASARGGFIVALAIYVCFLIFTLFPVSGPRYFYGVATGPIAEVWPARIVNDIARGGSSWGTAFPSSHVAATWCAVLALWRDARKAFWLLAPIALGLAVGTVYGQFHYAVDAVAGAVLAVVLFAAADPLRRLLTPAAPRS